MQVSDTDPKRPVRARDTSGNTNNKPEIKDSRTCLAKQKANWAHPEERQWGHAPKQVVADLKPQGASQDVDTLGSP